MPKSVRKTIGSVARLDDDRARRQRPVDQALEAGRLERARHLAEDLQRPAALEPSGRQQVGERARAPRNRLHVKALAAVDRAQQPQDVRVVDGAAERHEPANALAQLMIVS